MAHISTHVLDLARGKPAAGISLELHHGLVPRATTQTNADGRTAKPLVQAESLAPGAYSITFHVGDYFRAQNIEGFYEHITVSFVVKDVHANYHVPLLLSPYGYSTYRGS